MITKRKVQLNATISPFTKKQLEALVGSHHLFASGSDAVEKAIGMLYYSLHQDELANHAEAIGLPVQGRWG
jgi:Arc/MetJ-type ribon-helix-helix transcriptional regulator